MNQNRNTERTYKDFPEALRERMDALSMSFPGLAKEIDNKLSPTYIHNLASGKSRPTKGNIEVLAEGLDISPSYFKEYRDYTAKERIEADPDIADFLLDESTAKIPAEFARLNDEQKKAAVEYIKELRRVYKTTK